MFDYGDSITDVHKHTLPSEIDFNKADVYQTLASVFGRYVVCILHKKYINKKGPPTFLYFATPINPLYCGQKIYIDDTGGGKNGYEVVVEILQSSTIFFHGKVVHVYRRVEDDSRYRRMWKPMKPSDGESEIHDNVFHGDFSIMRPYNMADTLAVYQRKRDLIVFDHYDPFTSDNDHIYEVSFVKGFDSAFITGKCEQTVSIDVLTERHNILQQYDTFTISDINLPELDTSGVESLEDLDTWLIESTDDLHDIVVSFDKNGDDTLIYIHVPDVASFIGRDSEFCKYAETLLMSTCLPDVGPLHIFPKVAVSKLRLRDRSRLAYSVLFVCDASHRVKSKELMHPLIKVNRTISIDILDKVIKRDFIQVSEDISYKLKYLSDVFVKLYTSRNFPDSNNSIFEDNIPYPAKLVVNELYFQANLYVSEILSTFKDSVYPMLIQKCIMPQEWNDNLTPILRSFLTTCFPQLQDDICETFKRIDIRDEVTSDEQPQGLLVFVSRIEELKKDLDKSDSVLKTRLANANNFPEVLKAKKDLLIQPEKYVSSDDEEKTHFTLKVSNFSTFTHPFHRFTDFITQHLLLCYFDKTHVYHFDADGVDQICNLFNRVNRDNRLDNLEWLYLKEALRIKPLEVIVFIKSITETEFVFEQYSTNINSHILKIEKNLSRLPLNHFNICETPVFGGHFAEVTLEWQERIYDYLDSEPERSNQPIEFNEPPRANQSVVIDNTMHIKRLPLELSERISKLSSSAFDSNVRDLIMKCYENIRSIPMGLVCEVQSNVSISNFSTVYRTFDALKLQVSIINDKPSVQLVNLTPTLDICIEHQRNPGLCFAHEPRRDVKRNSYVNVDEFRSVWKDLVTYESVYSSIMGREGTTIRNITITWEKNVSDIYGTFEIKHDFYERSRRVIPRDGYLCVRYKDIPAPNDPNWIDSIQDMYDTQDRVTWVGHCSDVVVWPLEKGKACKPKNVKFHLFRSSGQFPSILLDEKKSKEIKATVEWFAIPKTFKHMLGSLDKLHDLTCVLAKDIALGERPGIVKRDKLPVPERLDVAGIATNENQIAAIKKVFDLPFGLIHGPPGTGKTLTGALLAYHFVQQNLSNNTGNDRCQVLYCTPSNRAADVLIEMLLKITKARNIDIIRVYSSRIEQIDFPLPGHQKNVEKAQYELSESNKHVALHHLIRKRKTGKQSVIAHKDKLFKMYPSNVKDSDIDNQKDAIFTASKELLCTANIVVTTCSGSGNSRVLNACQIRQVIIDEGGMCSEPEALIPITCHTPKQVVILGDHKQLETFVLTDAARDLGMKRSIFERYADQADILARLDVQYRMHHMIAKFPADEFYEGNLKHGTPEQTLPSELPFWPGGNECPIAFCHIKGSTLKKMVSTKDGSEQSRKNEAEAKAAIELCSLLQRHGVARCQIAILTQYRAQEALVKMFWPDEPVDDPANKVTVSTILASQGNEWDYVIMSLVCSIQENDPDRNSNIDSDWIKHKLGFIRDEHQMNVALTRAKKGLILIGDSELLKYHNTWSRLIDFYKDHKAFVKYDDFITKWSDKTV